MYASTKEVDDEWTLLDPRFEQLSAVEKKKAWGKSKAFNARYQVTTGHKSKGLSFVQIILKFL